MHKDQTSRIDFQNTSHSQHPASARVPDAPANGQPQPPPEQPVESDGQTIISRNATHTAGNRTGRTGNTGGSGRLSRGLSASDHTLLRSPTVSRMPEMIGNYRIKHELGRGGMGVVYMGVKEEGKFQRRVAIKLLKRGMDSEDILMRFEQERQLLGALSHPNIGRLYDTGSTPEGQPWYAMEFIEGLPLIEYCDRNHLKIEQRLKIFKDVCAAVSYAHRNLIVHRDLKPDNIIVTPDGVAKLLDFGIAKIINPELSLMGADPTAPELRIMTPEYASPEQVRGDVITTTSDVYSLGVLLYELLTGHRPYKLKERVRAEIERVILEEDPERPSTAISRIEEVKVRDRTAKGTGDTTAITTKRITPDSVGAMREIEPSRLRRRLSGDIDNIVLKAMAKEVKRRYQTADELAEDIERHLSGLPVQARPRSVTYVAGKFVRRHKASVAVAAMVLVAISLGIVGTMQAQARETAQANEQVAMLKAEQLEAQVAAQQERIDAKGDQCRELAMFMINEVQPEIEKLPGAVNARKIITEKVASFMEAQRDQAAADPEVLLQIAQGYMEVGQVFGGTRNPTMDDYARAEEFYTKAIAANQDYLQVKPDDPTALRQLSVIHTYRGDSLDKQAQYEKAGEQYEEALRIARRVYEANVKDFRSRRQLAHATLNIGAKYRRAGQHARAKTQYRESIEIREELAREKPEDQTLQRDLAVAYLRMAGTVEDLGELKEAKDWYVKSLEIRRKLQAANPDNNRETRDRAVGHLFLGEVHRKLEEKQPAIENLQTYINLTEALAVSSPMDARAQRDLELAYKTVGTVFSLTGDADRALADYQRMHSWFERRVEADPQSAEKARRVASSFETMANFIAENQPDESIRAVQLMKSAVEVSRPRVEGAQIAQPFIDLARQLARLGVLQQRGGLVDDARASLDEALKIYRDIGAPTSEHADLQAAYNTAREAREKLSQP